MGNNQHYKTIWTSFIERCQSAIAEGELFYPQLEKYLSNTEMSRTDFSLGSRYLPRGFYCPSPDIERIITNMRRGRIAKRLTKSSKPTNAYLFNKDNKLFLAETFYPNGKKEIEYILYKKNITYGFVFNSAGRITSISIEGYNDNRLCNYLWAACSHHETDGYKFFWVMNEDFCYCNNNQLETDFYIAQAALDRVHISCSKAVYNLDQFENVILNSRKNLLSEEIMLWVHGDKGTWGQGDGSVVPSGKDE